jgi:cytochrome b6-f complex iron-sulfur subunit
MTRQGFLQWLLKASLWSAGLAAASWPVLHFITWRQKKVQKIVFAPNELSPFSTRQGVILVPEGNSLLPLSAECTHLGCRVEYHEMRKELVCPCHKSAYTLQGRRLRGPAEKDLPVLEFQKLNNGDLEVILPLKG